MERPRAGILILLIASSTIEVASSPIFGDLHPAATTPFTHISSFLNQRKSDSRKVDKPDVFPIGGSESATTPGPTRVEIFKHGRILENIHERVSNAIAQGRKEGLQRLQNDGEAVETTTEFVGLSLEDDSDGPDIVFEKPSNTSEDSERPVPENESSKNTTEGGDGFFVSKLKDKTLALATRVITPLFSVWTAAQRNLHFPMVGGTESDQNESLEEQQQSSGGLQAWIKGGITQNLRETPFQAVFQKYSNFVGQGGKRNDYNTPGSFKPSRSDSAKIEANSDNDDLDDDDDKPSFDSDSADIDARTSSDGGRLMFNEGLGIYVLEIIGTIVGLTWGAISQIQNIFGSRQ